MALFPLIIVAYLIGSIPLAYLIARFVRGVDLRKYGSGNVGSSNVLQVTSKRWTLPVALFDVSKGLLAVWLTRWAGLDILPQFMVGITAVAGHNWPVFLGFRGGRGILSTLGVILAFSPLLGLFMAIIAFSMAPFKNMSLGVFIGLLALPVLTYYFADFFGIQEPAATTGGFAALTVLALGRRLVWRRSEVASGLSTRELLLNRLLFDRDIRDRKVWITRPENTGSKALS